MKQPVNNMEQRLGTEQPANRRNAPENDPEFEALVDEIAALIRDGKLPEGFDLPAAAKDPALVVSTRGEASDKSGLPRRSGKR